MRDLQDALDPGIVGMMENWAAGQSEYRYIHAVIEAARKYANPVGKLEVVSYPAKSYMAGGHEGFSDVLHPWAGCNGYEVTLPVGQYLIIKEDE